MGVCLLLQCILAAPCCLLICPATPSPASEQLDQQTHALAEAEARAGAAEEARAAAQLDVACLKRGLELAAEQLTRSAGAEVPCTLLRAVARVSLV